MINIDIWNETNIKRIKEPFTITQVEQQEIFQQKHQWNFEDTTIQRPVMALVS